MRKIYLLLLAAFAFTNIGLHAQSIANYVFSTNATGSLALDMNSNAIDMSSGTTTLIGPSLNSTASTLADIGFDFWVMGVKHSQFNTTTHGLIGMTTAIATGNNIAGGTGVRIGALTMGTTGTNMGTHATGKVHSKIFGTAPNRVLVVEWLNMSINSTSSIADATFQSRFYEATGTIEHVYGAVNVTAGGPIASVKAGFSTTTAIHNTVDFATQVANTTSNFSNSLANGIVTALNSSSNGSRRVYRFAPPVHNAPSGLIFTSVTQTGMTLNWTDNSANEVGFDIYRSDDGGATYNFISRTASNAITSVQTGLVPGVNYFWRIIAVSEGSFSSAAQNSQTTLAAGAKTSVVSGNWSDANTWTPVGVPAAGDNVIIDEGHTVTIDVTGATCNNLTIGTGSAPTFLINDATTVAKTLTVGNNIVIQDNGTIRSSSTSPASVTNHVISVAGNFTINGAGTFNGSVTANSKLNITFTNLISKAFTTSATSSLTINTVTINKGTTNAGILDFNPGNNWTNTAGTQGFVITNGTLKIIGTATIANTVFSTAGYTIAANGGFWLNNPNFTILGQNGSPTNSGLLRMTEGVYNVGSATGNAMGGAATSNFIIEGGTINFSGRLNVTSAGAIFNMSAGLINVTTIGNALTTTAGFGFTSTTSIFTMSGGTINLVQASTGATPYDYQVSTTSPTITGGTLNIGTAATATNFNFRVSGVIPALSFDNSGGNKTATLFAAATIYLNSTIPSGATLDLNATTGFALSYLGSLLTNNGTITGTGASCRLNFFGANAGNNAQTYAGSGIAGTPTIPLAGIGVSNVSGLTVNTQIITNRVNFFRGGIINAGNITLGGGAATQVNIQMGQTAGAVPAGGFDVAPVFNHGTGGLSLLYLQESVVRTSGFEIPASRVVGSVQINNSNGVNLTGGNLELSLGTTPTLTMTLGDLNMGANNLSLGLSATVPGTITYTAGLVNFTTGTFTRWFNTTGLNTSIANGGVGHFPIGFNGINRNLWLAFSTATALSTGGTITVSHQNASGISAVTPFIDGAVTIDNRTNANWMVSQSGLALTGTILARMQGSGNLASVGTVANLRMMRSADAVGTSSIGTGTATDPQVNRTGLDLSMLANTFYIGGPAADLSIPPITWVGITGNWSNPANWSSGIVPTSTDNVLIAPASAGTITVDFNYGINDVSIGSNATVMLGANTLTVNRNFAQTSGIFNGGSGILDVRGNFSRSGGTFTAGTGTTTFAGTTQTINATGSATTFNNLILTNGTKTFTTGATYAVGTGGSLMVTAGAEMALSAATTTTIAVAGNVEYNAGTGGTNIGSLTLSLTGTNNTLTTAPSAAVPNISIGTTGVYALMNDIEMQASRTLTVLGRLNCGTMIISGAGNLTVTGVSASNILGILGTTNPSGFNNVTLSGTINYNNTSGVATVAIIDYNALGNQTIDIATHPANTFIMCSNGGTKTLNSDYTFTVNSSTGGPGASGAVSKGALTVNPGVTFADGGFTITFPNNSSPWANVIIGGTYSSTAPGKLIWPLCSGSAIFATNNTTFGDIELNMTAASNSMRAYDGASTVNITARNMSFTGTGSTWNLSALGTTNLTITGNVSFISTDAGGFDGTSTKTSVVNLKGNINSANTATAHNIIGNVGTNSLVLNGTSPQFISLAGTNPTIIGTSATFRIDNPNGFSLGQALTIGGAFNMVQGSFNTGANNFTLGAAASAIFDAGSTLNIDNAGSTVNFAGRSVTFKSTSVGTARLATILGTLSNASNVTIERYIPASGRRAWRLLGSNVEAATAPTIRTAWQEAGGATATGTHITQAGGASGNGFDASTVAINSSIRNWDGTALQTLANTDVVKISDNGGAYFLFVRGNRTIDINNVTASSNTTLRQTGTVNQGFLSPGVAGASFSLIPNPYPSPVDYEAIVAANGLVGGGIYYIWDANLGSVGAYRTIQRTGANTYSSTPTTGSDNTMRYIRSGQAFFIPGNTLITFTEAMKTEMLPTVNVYRTGAGTEEMTIDLRVMDGSANGILYDGVRAQYNNTYSVTVNTGDAPKLNNFNENLAITRDNLNLAVEQRPLVDAADTIYLKLWNTGIKNYRFDINPSNFSATANLEAYLKDNFLNTTTSVSLSANTMYDFSVTSNTASAATNRFMIVYRASTPLPVNFTNVKAFTKNAGIQVEWNVAAEVDVVKYEVEKSTNGTSFDKAGTVTANNSKAYNWYDATPNNGNNYYRIKVINKDNSSSYSQVVNVKLGNTKGDIAVYPNPVKGSVINVQFYNQEKGTYNVQLINSLGQQVYSNRIVHQGGSASEALQLNAALSKGVYQLVLTNGERRITQQVIAE